MYYFDEAIRQKLLVREDIRAFRDYRALGLIVQITLTYWASVQLISFFVLALYCTLAESPRAILDRNGVNPIWFSAFHSVSSFNNAGFSLLADNLVPFANDRLILVVTSVEILLGNCLAPVSLRVIVWVMHHFNEDEDDRLSLLLHFPRTTFTHLFGPEATVMLVMWVLAFSTTEMVVFLWTNWNEQYMDIYDASTKVLIAFFQAITTRTAGFNAVIIFDTSLPMQFLYFMFMFLSA
jgi:trk system potassium uptake protein TrkH